ncbi:MAG: flagellar export protein FliJ [Pseudohongiellaceae bacterium]|nr:flagellar export protein FliJ [Pseudohongiellaceae bacterium]
MKRSKRMAVVVDLAKHKVQEAAKAVAYVQNQLRQEEGQLVQLHEFLDEYRANSREQGSKGISVQQFRIYNDFAENVEQAIVQQKQQIGVVEGQLEQVRQHWRHLDARFKGLEKLLDKIIAEEEAEAERQLQKEQDEFASRSNRRVW